METATMGRVTVPAKIENLKDLYTAELGHIPADQVRKLEISDALVDTGAFGLFLPQSMIQALGLKQRRTRPIRSSSGVRQAGVYEAVRLTIQGRECAVDVHDVPDGTPVLIGQIPLEAMDWVVDPKGQRLIGNPEHNGEYMGDAF